MGSLTSVTFVSSLSHVQNIYEYTIEHTQGNDRISASIATCALPMLQLARDMNKLTLVTNLLRVSTVVRALQSDQLPRYMNGHIQERSHLHASTVTSPSAIHQGAGDINDNTRERNLARYSSLMSDLLFVKNEMNM